MKHLVSALFAVIVAAAPAQAQFVGGGGGGGGGVSGDGLTINCSGGVCATIGNVVLNSSSPSNITANQWTQGTDFVTTTGGINYPLLASTSYNNSARISINPVGVSATLTPSGGDTINGTNAALTIPSGSHAVVAKTATGAFEVSGLASAGGSGWELTDGTTDLTGVTKVTVSGGTVGGSTPNATLTITGGSGSLTKISTQTPTASAANCTSPSISCIFWTGLSTYNTYEMICTGTTASGSNQSLYLQVGESTGPTWETGTTAYQWGASYLIYTGSAGTGSSTGDAGVNIPFGTGSSTPSVTGDVFVSGMLSGNTFGAFGRGITPTAELIGGGTYSADTNAKTALRLIYATNSSGSSFVPLNPGMTAGSCTLYGYSP